MARSAGLDVRISSRSEQQAEALARCADADVPADRCQGDHCGAVLLRARQRALPLHHREGSRPSPQGADRSESDGLRPAQVLQVPHRRVAVRGSGSHVIGAEPRAREAALTARLGGSLVEKSAGASGRNADAQLLYARELQHGDVSEVFRWLAGAADQGLARLCDDAAGYERDQTGGDGQGSAEKEGRVDNSGEAAALRGKAVKDLESPSQADLRKIFSRCKKKSYGFKAPVRIFSPTLGICPDVCSDAPIPTAGGGPHHRPHPELVARATTTRRAHIPR